MEATVVRHCPNCGARVKGEKSLFASPCRCPSCGERAQFYDYPEEPTPSASKVTGRHDLGWSDRLLWIAIGTSVTIAVVSVWFLFNGFMTTMLASSIVCLLAGLGCVGYVLILQRRIDRAQQDKKKFERALMVSNSKVTAAAELNRGFKKNFDALVEEARNRALQEISSREERARQMETLLTKQVAENSKVLPTIDFVAGRLLDETVHRLSKDLNASNLTVSRGQLKQVIEFCRENGANIKKAQEEDYLGQLEMDHQTLMLEAKYKNERLQVETKMREEQKVIEEIEHDIRSAEAERSSIAKSLSAILRDSEGASESQITDLQEKLRLAEQKMSEASATMRSTTAGHVFVLSNIGSFGEGVYLIGATRLADPRHFIEELSAIAVPYPFDIHMLIPSGDAQKLASELCESLHDKRLNRFNHGRNFFKCDIKTIWQQVIAHHGAVDYVEESFAEEYRQSAQMTEEAFQQMTDMHQTPEKYRDPFEVRNSSE